MKKIAIINNKEVTFYILQVFDEKLGHINEHILAIDITAIYYENESVVEAVGLAKKDFAGLKAIYYRISADNCNTIYITTIGKGSEKHAVADININSKDCKKYALTIDSLRTNY